MPPRKKPGEFKVHGSAAVKKTTRKPVRKPAPVKVIQVHPDAMKLAREMAAGQDVHLVINTDGSVEIRNGEK